MSKKQRDARKRDKKICRVCGKQAVRHTGYCREHYPEHKRHKLCRMCDARAVGGTGYCLKHLPDEMRCNRITTRGNPCRLPAKEGGVCKMHLVTMRRGYGTGKRGWVYVYDTTSKENGRGIYKIGRSVNPKAREQEFAASNPFGKILFAGFVGGKAKWTEAYLHRQYEPNWIRRELFCLTDTELAKLRCSLKGASSKWQES